MRYKLIVTHLVNKFPSLLLYSQYHDTAHYTEPMKSILTFICIPYSVRTLFSYPPIYTPTEVIRHGDFMEEPICKLSEITKTATALSAMKN